MNAQTTFATEIIAQARRLMDDIFTRLQSVPLGANRREQIPRLLWQHAIEDGDAVIILIEQHRYASARSLLRPQLESLARAAWAKFIATADELDSFGNGSREPPGINNIMQRLVAAAISDDGVLIIQQLWQNRGSAFHDTTHRGTRAIARLALSNHGADDHVPDDALPVIYISSVCAGVGATSMLADIGRRKDADAVSRALAEFMTHAHQFA